MAMEENELMEAERIVIIGYSFPATDIRILNLIKTVLEKRKGEIDLVVVSPSVNETILHIELHIDKYAKSFNAIPLKCEDYVFGLWNDAPGLMRQAMLDSEEVEKWAMMIYMLSQGFPLND